jgi:hypothetical protein
VRGTEPSKTGWGGGEGGGSYANYFVQPLEKEKEKKREPQGKCYIIYQSFYVVMRALSRMVSSLLVEGEGVG